MHSHPAERCAVPRQPSDLLQDRLWLLGRWRLLCRRWQALCAPVLQQSTPSYWDDQQCQKAALTINPYEALPGRRQSKVLQ